MTTPYAESDSLSLGLVQWLMLLSYTSPLILGSLT